MGSFWDLDAAGKEAQGWPREYGAWSAGQFKNWLPRSDDRYSAGQSASDWYGNYNMGRARDGFGSIATMRDYGSQIMPGVNDYIANKADRINQQIADYNSKVPTGAATADTIDRTLSDEGEYIRQNRDYALNDVGDTYARANASEDAAHDTSVNAYELLKPGSQFQQAQVARSFAGSNAATAGRLRRGGLDPNSPQAIAMMQRGAVNQARAMDDAAAAGTDKYIGAKMGEAQRHAGAAQGIDLNRSNRAIGIQDKTLDRTIDWEGQNAQAALTRKGLMTQDWETNKALTDQLSGAEREAIGLRKDEYDAGAGYHSADLAEKNAGAAGVGNYGQQQIDNSFRASNTALGWGNTANDAYKTAYSYEAPQAGWGAKMIAAAGGAALDMVAPGAGTALSGAISPQLGVQTPTYGAPSQSGAPGGGGQPGGYGSSPYGTGPYGTPPYLPQAQPQAQNGTGGWQQGLNSLYQWMKPKIPPQATTGTASSDWSNY